MSIGNTRNACTALGLLVGLGLLGCLAGCSGDDNGNGATTDGGGTADASTADTSVTPTLDSSTTMDSSAKDTSTGGGDATMDSTATDAPTADVSHGDAGDAGETGVTEGNAVIADQYNNRVIEVDENMNIVWTFGDGKPTVGPTSVVAPNDSERLPNGQTLISGTGDPGATGPACAALDAGGCSDNRVLLVNADGGIAWMYSDLSGPVCARMLPNGRALITDQGNNRIIEVLSDGGADAAPAWEYAPTTSDGGSFLSGPNSAERTAAGTTLVADEGNGRVVEVGSDGGVVWQYTVTSDAGTPQVAYASRLPNGNTLITDATDNLIIEVGADGGVAWTYTVTNDGGPAPQPTRAVRLANGHTLISDQGDNRVFEIDSTNKIVVTYAKLAGDGGALLGPYDGKRVGDYTGVTAPQ